MSYLSGLDAGLQGMNGGVGLAFGQTYQQYRVTGATNVGILTGSPVNAAFPAMLKMAKRTDIENAARGMLVFDATCDDRTLQLYDVLVEVGYGAMANGIFTVAQKRPAGPTLLVRTESLCTIHRPDGAGDMTDQTSVSEGAFDAGRYGGNAQKDELVLTLTNGVYAWASPGSTAAQVPCGLQPLNRVRDGNQPGTPVDLGKETFALYGPDLGSAQLQERDIIGFDSGDQFVLNSIFRGITGLVGTFCLAEKATIAGA